jgi:phage-related minor tail protein
MNFAYESTGEKLRRVQEVNRALEARNQALQVELTAAMKKVRELEAMQAQGSFEGKAHPCATGETTWEEK